MLKHVEVQISLACPFNHFQMRTVEPEKITAGTILSVIGTSILDAASTHAAGFNGKITKGVYFQQCCQTLRVRESGPRVMKWFLWI